MLFLPLFISFSVDFAMSAIMVNVFTIKFNPFSTSVSLLYPLKTSENRRFSTVFRRWRKCALVTNPKNSSDHWLTYNHLTSLGDFSILNLESKRFFIELIFTTDFYSTFYYHDWTCNTKTVLP